MEMTSVIGEGPLGIVRDYLYRTSDFQRKTVIADMRLCFLRYVERLIIMLRLHVELDSPDEALWRLRNQILGYENFRPSLLKAWRL